MKFTGVKRVISLHGVYEAGVLSIVICNIDVIIFFCVQVSDLSGTVLCSYP